jgi:hypothetical protein
MFDAEKGRENGSHDTSVRDGYSHLANSKADVHALPWNDQLRESHWLQIFSLHLISGARGSVVVKALCYKPKGRGFDTR